MFLLSGVRLLLNAQINKYTEANKHKTVFNIFSNAKFIHQLIIHVRFFTFASLMQGMPLTTSVVRIKNVRYVLTKAINVRIFSLVILF